MRTGHFSIRQRGELYRGPARNKKPFEIKNPPGPRLGAVTKGIPYYTKAFLYYTKGFLYYTKGFLYYTKEFLTRQRESVDETSKTLLSLHEN